MQSNGKRIRIPICYHANGAVEVESIRDLFQFSLHISFFVWKIDLLNLGWLFISRELTRLNWV